MDDFVTLNLEKLDRYIHLRGTGLDELEWRGSDDEDGPDSGSDEEGEESEDEGEDGDELEPLEDDAEEDEVERERRHAALTASEKVGKSRVEPLQMVDLAVGSTTAVRDEVPGCSEGYCPIGRGCIVHSAAGREPSRLL